MPYNGALGNRVLTRSDLWQWRRGTSRRLSRQLRQRDMPMLSRVSRGASVISSLRHALPRQAALMATRPSRPGKLTPDQLRMIPVFARPGAKPRWFVERFGPPANCRSSEEKNSMFRYRPISRGASCAWTPQVPVLRAMQRRRQKSQVAENCQPGEAGSSGANAKPSPGPSGLYLRASCGLAKRRANALRSSGNDSRPFVGDGRHHSHWVLQSGAARVAQQRACRQIIASCHATFSAA